MCAHPLFRDMLCAYSTCKRPFIWLIPPLEVSEEVLFREFSSEDHPLLKNGSEVWSPPCSFLSYSTLNAFDNSSPSCHCKQYELSCCSVVQNTWSRCKMQSQAHSQISKQKNNYDNAHHYTCQHAPLLFVTVCTFVCVCLLHVRLLAFIRFQ